MPPWHLTIWEPLTYDNHLISIYCPALQLNNAFKRKSNKTLVRSSQFYYHSTNSKTIIPRRFVNQRVWSGSALTQESHEQTHGTSAKSWPFNSPMVAGTAINDYFTYELVCTYFLRSISNGLIDIQIYFQKNPQSEGVETGEHYHRLCQWLLFTLMRMTFHCSTLNI